MVTPSWVAGWRSATLVARRTALLVCVRSGDEVRVAEWQTR